RQDHRPAAVTTRPRSATRGAKREAPVGIGRRAFFLPGAPGILGPSSPPGAAPPMFRALALVLLASLSVPAFADDKAQTQKQLEAARADVAELKKLLEKLQQEKSGVQKELKRT